MGYVVTLLCFGGALLTGAAAVSPYDRLIGTTARQHGIEPALVKAVVKCESRFDPRAVSPRGAQGLMQLMPTTQSLLGLVNAFDPQRNIAAGVRYLAMLQQIFGNDVSLLLAAYNAGPQAVIAAGYAIPPFAETQRYVRCVLAARQHYRQSGLNEQFPAASTTRRQTAEERDLVIAPLRLSHHVARVGQRVTVHLEARYVGTEVSHGVVILTYPEPLVSLIALRTSERETIVRLPAGQTGNTIHAAWAPTAYQFLRGAWPMWQPGQRRTAVLALVPRVLQDLALHLSVLVYDATEITLRQRWSTVVHLPVRARTW
jgi:hypothetical protein